MGDAIFDLEVTSNRPDCLSVLGVVHEIAALTQQPTHIAEPKYAETTTPIESRVSVAIDAPDLCPRYAATLITGIKIGPSPQWMQDRLTACGLRPISNIVDVSNYVMLEYGQPLHTFDFDLVKGNKIIVRRARSGESMTTLDGEERKLTTDMVVVADAERAVALAGIMGGANTQVTGGTVNILLEAANWHAPTIRRTARELKIASDAAYRFERNLSPDLVLPAIKRATQLIAELGGGQVANGVIDVYPGKKEPRTISITSADTKRMLGVEFDMSRIQYVLTSLGFDCRKEEPALAVTVPFWRSDVTRTVDLVEEVARIIGYDQIPDTLLGQELPKQRQEPVIALKKKARTALTGFGLQEILSYSLSGSDLQAKTSRSPEARPMARLLNPMSGEQEFLRLDLRAGLLTALAANRRFEDGGIRLFELGRVYEPKPGKLPGEPEIVCGILSGARQVRWWHGGEETMDFFDAKGMVEGLFSLLGVTPAFEPSKDNGLHPAKQAAVTVGGRPLGWVGEVHPAVLQNFEITGTAAMFAVNLTELCPLLTAAASRYEQLARFPAVTRDLALVVDLNVAHGRIAEIIRSFELVQQVQIFDVFSGGKIPAGKKSMAYRVTYLSPAHTLTDEEVNRVQQQMLEKLAKDVGAVLRG
jgi:phenylalanyl-tRNA synthetase beta chain